MSYRKKLIEVALPLDDINVASAREKSIRHGHPSTLHLWWARRPLAACRAVLFAQLVDDPSAHPERFPSEEEQNRERERLFAIIRRLVQWENINNEEVLEEARREIRQSAGPAGPPPLLDPFAGGGSIPLEGQRLGLEVYASDLNPVAVLINKALIELPPRFAGQPPVNPAARGEGPGAPRLLQSAGAWPGARGLAEDVRYYGGWMRDEAERRIGHLYPRVKLPPEQGGGEATVIAWLWARTVTCPNPACAAQMPLVRSFALSTKSGRQAWVEPVIDRSQQPPVVRFTVQSGRGQPREGTVNRRGATCICCETAVPFDYIRDEGKAGRMSAKLMAIVAEGQQSRIYLPPTPTHEAIAQQAQPQNVPDTDLPEKALGFRVQLYGMTKHRDLFTPRQLVALTTFSDLVGVARAQVQADAQAAGLSAERASAYADAVATYLAFAVDRSADRGSTICTWDSSPKMEALRNTFARQAIPMTWDFAEGNPFSASSGNWLNNVDWIVDSVVTIPASTSRSNYVIQSDALNIRKHDAPLLLSTDPPYCLAPGTLVQTPGGFVPVEAVRVGDQVLTHQGRFARVTRTYCRDYEGVLHRLKVAHVNQPLLITAEHPVYGIRTGPCRVGYADYCRHNCPWLAQNGQCRQRLFDQYALEWIPAGQVRRHDLIFTPTMQTVSIPSSLSLREWLPPAEYVTEGAMLHYQKATSASLRRRKVGQDAERQYQIPDSLAVTPDLCRLLGYFVAEGYTRVEHDGGTVQFTFHADESELLDDVCRLMQSCFGLQPGKATDNRPNNNQSIRLNFYSKPIATLLRNWCYTKDRYKRFPPWAVQLPVEYVSELLRGYWAGDGCRINTAYQANTNSAYLAGQLRMMLQRLGIVSRLHSHQIKPNFVNGKIVKPRGFQYAVHISGRSLVELSRHVGEPKKEPLTIQRGGQHGHWWEGGYLLPVRSVELVEYSGKVYNLETEDHSYTTAAGCVHNCDNIGYADLSDFFYVWLRRALQSIYPALFSTLLVPKAQELVSTPYRFGGDRNKAKDFFEGGLHKVFVAARGRQTPDYPVTIFYAFKQAEEEGGADGDDIVVASTGWETILESLIRAGFQITGTWPMRTELANRSVSLGTNALASSIVLVCRPKTEEAPFATRRDFLTALRRELPAALKQLQQGNIAPVDLAQASIGPGMAIYSRYSRVLEADGSAMRVRTALALINQALDEYLAEQEGEYDADTRWALAWFEQHGFEEGLFGDAETLSKAKNTSVQGLVEAGILYARGGKVRLLRRTELPADWRPTGDKRLTVWEVTQHLIRALQQQGEPVAGALLAQVDALGEIARDLAYRLYQLCERKGWAQEALPYNSLVISWPELVRHAQEQSRTAPVQGHFEIEDER